MVSLILWILPRHRAALGRGLRGALACLGLATLFATAAGAAEQPRAGVAIVPDDAAFFSATLRLREQYEILVKSNAFAALRSLPFVERALASLREQAEAPGSPISTFNAFAELPENREAAELFADMVANDTFLYGEPSCVTFARFLQAVAAARRSQAAEALQAVEDDDVAGFHGDRIGHPLAQVGVPLDEIGELQAAILEAATKHPDLLVVPDVVWGFRTTKRRQAESQLARLEGFLKLIAEQAGPDARPTIARRELAGGDVLTISIDGDALPWDDLAAGSEDPDVARRLADRLRKLDLVVAVGLVGDWVLVSVGDSVDHLDDLALPGSGRQGLLDTPAFAPLRDHLDDRLTGISYASAPFLESQAMTAADGRSYVAMLNDALEPDALSDEAETEVGDWIEDVGGEIDALLPEPGPWLSFSYLTERGYEGYVWDRATNQPFDDSRRLDLVEHAGGAPLGLIVTRLRSDPGLLDTLGGLAARGWKLIERHARPQLDGDDAVRFDEFAEHVAPLGGRAAAIIRDKILPSLADGQVGLVFDAKGKTKRPQAALPSSAEPLPLVEPAIVVPLADPKRFREGLSDLFALTDELADALLDMESDRVAVAGRLADPQKAKVEGGTVWSWSWDDAGLDEQLRPAIGVGEKAAVFSVAPAQAGRLLTETRLETGSQLTTFEEPLAGAAAVDVAGLIDALGPWIVYAIRYGCEQEREGTVGPASELSAQDETAAAKEAIEHLRVALEAAKSLRAVVAETSFKDGALVTHWRNVIRDIPAR